MSTHPEAAVEFRDVDIIFGKGSARQQRRQREAALRLLDAGRNRAEIAAETGAVLGVAGANLKVARGQICVLMGLSGSGKSTLLRAANGLNQATRGQAMVFQQFALLPWRSVRENVGFGLELRGLPPEQRRRIVDEKLRLVGLDQWGDRYAAELSGGMQQRVGLARAFATDADILLMDEPFSALDPLIRTKLQDELLALQAAVKKTILFVSHDLDEALKLGNMIAIMEGGRIVQTGTPEDIVLRPADDYVAEFVQHMNPLNVLRAGTVMRPLARLRRDGASVWLDGEGRYAVALNGAGEPIGARCNGMALPVVPVPDPEAAMSPRAIALVPCDTPLRRVVQLRQASGHPVLLEEGGRLTGVCDDAEMLGALCGVARAEVAEPAAA
jgi:glycine betaine/proline transport system ATP-binding protein